VNVGLRNNETRLSCWRFTPDYSDPLLDIGRLLAALGQCQPTPLLNSTLSMTPETTPLAISKVSKRIGIGSKERRNMGTNSSAISFNITSYNETSVLFHAGLLQVAEDLLVELMPYLNACPPTAEIRLIGHSLGTQLNDLRVIAFDCLDFFFLLLVFLIASNYLRIT